MGQEAHDARDVDRAVLAERQGRVVGGRAGSGLEQPASQGRVGLVARAIGHDEAVQVGAQERQVADHVEDLVPRALIGEPERVADDPVPAEEEQVGLGRPDADPRGPQGGGFRFEQERPARGDLVAERIARQADAVALRADRRVRSVVEVIREGQPAGGSGRVDGQDGIPLADAHRLLDHKGPAHPVLLDEPRVVEGLDERAAGAVAAGALAGVDLDHGVVNLEAGQGGHDMLDHLDGGVTAADRGPPLRGHDRIEPGRDPRPAGEVGPLEDDPLVRLGRMEADHDVRAVEEADPVHFRRSSDRPLPSGRPEHSPPLPLIRESDPPPAPALGKPLADRPRARPP